MKISNLKILLIFLFANILSAQDEIEVEHFYPDANVLQISGFQNEVWFATNGNGIIEYDKKKNKWNEYSSSKNNIQQDFFHCIAVNNNLVFAGSTDGLFILNKKTNKWIKRKFSVGGQLGNWIRAIKFDPTINSVWIGRFQYLTKYEINSRRFTDYDLTIKRNEKTNTIKTIEVDGDSLVWFGTEAGLHKYYKGLDLNSNDASKFYDNRLNYFRGEGDEVSISDILIEQNNVWVGTDEFTTPDRPRFNVGGLYKYDRRNDWQRFDVSRGLSGNGIYAVERTGNLIWVALYQFGSDTKEKFGRGLAVINTNTNKVRMIYNEKLPNRILDIYFDGDFIWLASDMGIYRVNLSNNLAKF
jgi:hypothetical protein